MSSDASRLFKVVDWFIVLLDLVIFGKYTKFLRNNAMLPLKMLKPVGVTFADGL